MAPQTIPEPPPKAVISTTNPDEGFHFMSTMFESADVERTKQSFADGGERYDWKLVHPTRLAIEMMSQKDSV